MNSDAAYIRLGMRIFADMSGSIAIPCVLAAVAGEWVDTRYGTAPWVLILFLLIAFFGSALLIARKAVTYDSEYKKLMADHDKTDKTS